MPGRRLVLEERVAIEVGIARGESATQIAREIGRPASAVTRELIRDGGRDRYCAVGAQRRADRDALRPRAAKLEAFPALAERVRAALEVEKLSPMVIAIGLRAQGGVEGVTISHEAIYQAVYAHGRRGLPAGIHHCLHRRRPRRKPHCREARTPTTRGPLGSFTLIGSRPEEIWDRLEPGHWEGDLIIGKLCRSAVVTLIERQTRYGMLASLPEGHDATSVLAALVELLDRVPEPLRLTLTWDQGREMARHDDLAAIMGIDVYFCEPHKPWQRPSNEAYNGLVRRWLPKSTDLGVHSQAHLDTIAERVNHMPRRALHWNSAHQLYTAHVATVT